MWYFFAAGALVVSGVGAYFLSQKSETFDVLADFKAIKTAMRAFRNQNIGLTKGIENLEPYLPKGTEVDLDRYLLSIDDKFLIVKKLPRGLDPNKIVTQVGGQSKYADGKLRLSFFTLSNAPEPVAVIKYQPMNNITTKTKIEYSHEDSITDNREILKVEWENNEEYFDEEGVHTVRLKVMDKHFRWSNWESVDIFVSEAKGVKSITGSGGHVVVTYNNGRTMAYGENSFGQLGNCTNQSNEKLEPLVQVSRVEESCAGDYHTLFLKSDGRVFAAGKNDFGQLGIGNRNHSKIPKLTWGLENIVQVACNGGMSAAVTTEGYVYTWGQNENGALASTDAHYIDRPARVEGVEHIKQISVGRDYMMALGFDGNVFGWGANESGELGLGFKSKHNEPAISVLKSIKQIACGNGFTLAVTSGGKILGIGSNKYHQLGYEGEQYALFPKELPSLKNVAKVVTGGEHTIALDEMGNVYAWGQFSPVDESYAIKPYQAEELKYVKDIAATSNKGYALMEDGTVYEFGSKFSQLRKLEVSKAVMTNEE